MLNNTIYRNNKTNLIGTITSSSEETKRVTLTFEDGTEKELAISTLKDKRQYTPITEEEYNKLIRKEVEKEVKKAKKSKKEATAKKPHITINYNGKEYTPKEFAELVGTTPQYIRKQLRNGKAIEDIIKAKGGHNEPEKKANK